ncbi:F-box/LRR-repeat protein 6-like [Tubulanus polymorphus]|uniref:F-box/LRR-repeat protein 6-like n=1 Tax=Tubulanus polymorphus TaxID=672921 RepID=UPI003DA500BA
MPMKRRGLFGMQSSRTLFSFIAKPGEEWSSDDSGDSDYRDPGKNSEEDEDDDEYTPKSKKPKRSTTKTNGVKTKRKSTRKTATKSKKTKNYFSDDDDNDDDDDEDEDFAADTPSTSSPKQLAKISPSSKKTNNKKINHFNGRKPSDAVGKLWGKWMPPEVLTKIFTHVIEEAGAIPFLINAGRTCRLWHDTSLQLTLWRDVDLTYGWITQTDRTMYWLCSNRLTRCTHLNVTGWKNLTNSGFQAIVDSCLELESINLSGCGKISSSSLKELVDKCPSVRFVGLSDTSADMISAQSLRYLISKQGSTLTGLDLSNNNLLGFYAIFVGIMENCRNLRSLNISNITGMTGYISMNVEKFQEGCPKLEVLMMANTKIRPVFATKDKKDESLGFPALRELSVASVNDASVNSSLLVDDDLLCRILKNATNLSLLDVRGCCNLTADCVYMLEAKSLKYLYVSHSPVTKYEGIQVILQKWHHSLLELDLAWNVYPGMSLDIAIQKLSVMSTEQPVALERLNLSGTSIDCHRIRSLLLTCPNLKELNLQSCRGLPRGMKRLYEGDKLTELIDNIDDICSESNDL